MRVSHKILRFLLLGILIALAPGYAQTTVGDAAKIEYRYLIDMPTAGVLKKGMVAISNDILPGGVMISRMEVGVFDDVSFGIGYGGANIIGTGSPKWYKLPSAALRVKVMREALAMPALTVGFDMQGKGLYDDEKERYQIKSPGLFVAAYKSFSLMGYMLVHAAVNYSLEQADGDNFMNLQIGAEKTISAKVSIIGEYNFALNDNTKDFGKGRGYLNLGVRWAPADGMTIGLDLRDLLNNKKWSPGSADRGLTFEFFKAI
jgi:hypothetical protein